MTHFHRPCYTNLLPIGFIQGEVYKTLSVGVVTELIRGDIYCWGALMAACIMGLLPIIVL